MGIRTKFTRSVRLHSYFLIVLIWTQVYLLPLLNILGKTLNDIQPACSLGHFLNTLFQNLIHNVYASRAHVSKFERSFLRSRSRSNCIFSNNANHHRRTHCWEGSITNSQSSSFTYCTRSSLRFMSTIVEHQSVCSFQVVKMFFIIVTIFGVCWLPYHAYFIYAYHDNSIVNKPFIQHVYLFFYWLAMANTMVNPIVYYWMNKRWATLNSAPTTSLI